MSHEWFNSINWQKLEAKEVTAPFVPKQEKKVDLRYFSKQFTQMKIPSETDECLEKENYNPAELATFKDFEYVG